MKLKKLLVVLLVLFLSVFTFAGCDDGGDTIAPAEVTGADAAVVNNVISVSWVEPADSDFDHVDISFQGVTSGTAQVDKGTSTYDFTGLTEESEYSITIKTVDSSGNISLDGVTIKAIAQAVTFYGYWKSTYGDGFEIDTTVDPPMFYSYKNEAKDKAFWGEVVSSPVYSSSDVYVTVEITGNDGIAAGDPDWGNDDMTVGSFTVVRILDFSGKTCKEASSPYKYGEARVKTTRVDAETEFTDANGYYGYPADYTKISTPSSAFDGYWKSTYGDGFKIDATTFPPMFYSYKNEDKDVAFWGEVVSIVDYSATDCYLTLQLKGNDSIAAGDPTWGNDDMTVDSYTVIRMKNIAGRTCKEASSPYKFGEARVRGTQADAESEYTDTNGYYDYLADYFK